MKASRLFGYGFMTMWVLYALDWLNDIDWNVNYETLNIDNFSWPFFIGVFIGVVLWIIFDRWLDRRYKVIRREKCLRS